MAAKRKLDLTCPDCKKVTSEVKRVYSQKQRPQNGDIIVCNNCGRISILTRQRVLKAVSSGRLKKLKDVPEFKAALEMRRNVQKKFN